MELEGYTLGEKQKHFNKLVSEAISHKNTISTSHDGDIEKLMRIEIACKTRDVDFILDTFKCNDMLLVSRAIKHSTWLITEEQYEHIINPEYLKTKLAPHMMTKAFNKLMLQIRIKLKDERRVELFFTHEREINTKYAFKWLYNCSVSFIIKNVVNCDNIPLQIVRRLCLKSELIFDVFLQKEDLPNCYLLSAALFMTKRNPQKFIDVVKQQMYFTERLGPGETSNLMKKYPDWIINNIEKIQYYNLHIPTFARHLNKRNEIETFLLNNLRNNNLKDMYDFYYLKYFIWCIHEPKRSEFVQKILINKEIEENDNIPNSHYNISATTIHRLYQFVQFDIAFRELKKLIRIESRPQHRSLMIEDLLQSAVGNLQNIEVVLQYYYDKHINEQLLYRKEFINNLLTLTNPFDYTDQMWGILNELFYSMQIYTESETDLESDVQNCIQTIIVHHNLRGENVPEIIERKFQFNTLKSMQKKIKQDNTLFTYLYDYLKRKLDSLDIINENEFNKAVSLTENLLRLMKDWQKELHDYPFVINKIKELIDIRRKREWKTKLTSIYNAPWRRDLFEFSIDLCPSQGVCINALKHDPKLLSRNKEQVDAISRNDAISLHQLLTKLRLYWPRSLASEWTQAYLERLENHDANKSLIIGLCNLLPRPELLDLLQKYKPDELKIQWSTTDVRLFNIRKCIAKHIHVARPMAPLDAVLWYAKGDYLQFTLPSLNAILYNSNSIESQRNMHKLINEPPRLQKYCIRLIFVKLNFTALKPILRDIWKHTKNASIRAILFIQTYSMLCKERNQSVVTDIWNLLNDFIGQLTPNENKIIYRKLYEYNKVPINVRGEYFEKAYLFLKSLPSKSNCEMYVKTMNTESAELIELLSDDFVLNTILKNVLNELATNCLADSRDINTITTFLLSSQNEDIQIKRYKLLLEPILNYTLTTWNKVHNGYHINKDYIQILFNHLGYNLKMHIFNKKVVPVKMFQNIKDKLEEKLLLEENYVFLTKWKLMTSFILIVQEHECILADLKKKSLSYDDRYNSEHNKIQAQLNAKIAPSFAKICSEYLKQDIEKFSSSICDLFAIAVKELLSTCLNGFTGNYTTLLYFKCILEYDNSINSYLLVYKLLDIHGHGTKNEKDTLEEINKLLYNHPSEELKFHYFSRFDRILKTNKQFT